MDSGTLPALLTATRSYSIPGAAGSRAGRSGVMERAKRSLSVSGSGCGPLCSPTTLPNILAFGGWSARSSQPGRIKALRPRVEELTDARMQLLAAKGEADAIAVLAIPLPLTLMGELLGIPPDDCERCRELVEATIAADRPDAPKELIDRAQCAGDTLQAYFIDLIARRQKAPGDDLLSTLVAISDQGDRLTRDELISMAVLLFIAGFTTTANLIGNGLLALLKHPEQFACIQDNPSLVPAAVEKMLRYDTPVQTNGRTMLEPLELSGQVLAAREMVVTLVKRFAIAELIVKDPPRRQSLNQHGLNALLVHVVPR